MPPDPTCAAGDEPIEATLTYALNLLADMVRRVQEEPEDIEGR